MKNTLAMDNGLNNISDVESIVYESDAIIADDESAASADGIMTAIEDDDITIMYETFYSNPLLASVVTRHMCQMSAEQLKAAMCLAAAGDEESLMALIGTLQ